MLLLLLHITGNAAFALLVRTARSHRFDYAAVGLTNYATAAVISATALALARPPSLDAAAAFWGTVNGLQYQTTYLLMYVLIGLAGIAVTTSFLRLSVAVPVLASIAIWQEWPRPAQALGLLLAAAALPLLGSTAQRGALAAPSGAGHRHASPIAAGVLIAATILISGSGQLAAKAFAELHRPEQRPVYVFAVYAAATLLSIVTWPWRARLQGPRAPGPRSTARGSGQRNRPFARGRLGRAGASVLLGTVIGAVNVGQIWVLLPALAQVPGVIAFPLAAAGGLTLTALGGRLLWREPLGGRTGAGIALAILAAALVNAG
jgi:drug/metabolite transporter (DMT)-like permease